MVALDRCQAPGCGQPLQRRATGRPPKYCGPNCKKRAHRAKAREIAAEQERAARLAAAQRTIGQSWRSLEAAAAWATELIPSILACAASNDLDALALHLDDWQQTAGDLEHHARTLSAATALAKQLSSPDRLRPRQPDTQGVQKTIVCRTHVAQCNTRR